LAIIRPVNNDDPISVYLRSTTGFRWTTFLITTTATIAMSQHRQLNTQQPSSF